MIARGAPLVRYGRNLINLSKIDYMGVRKESGTDRSGYPKTTWKFHIHFSTPSRQLSWTFDTEVDALAALEHFEKMNETFLMAELP